MNNSLTTKLESFKRYHFDYSTTVEFIGWLNDRFEVIAPHKKGASSYTYQLVDDPNEVELNYPRTIQPLKKAFMPPKETLINFNLKSNAYSVPKLPNKRKLFFGIHSYEMQSIKRLDYNFKKGNPEKNYLSRRKDCLFIGIAYTPDKWHFSSALGIDIEETEGFCLYFYPQNNGYIVFEITDTGGVLIRDFGKGVAENDQPLEIKSLEFQNKIKFHYNRLPEIFKHIYNSKVWKTVAEKCVGCGTCNILCPTCYCFDVHDEIELNAEDGSRSRQWDGCMLNTFALVAGNENFRTELANRTRHRLYRKFKYITDDSNMLHCVGCGRCSRYCPADISLVGILNDLIDDYTNKPEKQLL